MLFSLVTSCAKTISQMFFDCGFTYLTTIIFSRPSQDGCMVFWMFTWSNNHQIFLAIVQCIAIQMMNMKSFWRVSNYPMFIFPNIRLSNFNSPIKQSISRLVLLSCANFRFWSKFIKQILPKFFQIWVKILMTAIFASWRIVISISIRTFYTLNRSATYVAWFCKKSFHLASICLESEKSKCLLKI